MKISKKRLISLVAKFAAKRILVVGDLILDHYISGSVERISPEAPVPVVWARKENFTCGGAANVGLNIVALSARSSLCGVLGADDFAAKLLGIIKNNSISAGLLVKDKSRPTSIKTRILGQHQQIVRVDWESVEPLSLEINNRLLAAIRRVIDDFDAVIIEDYGKGVINPGLLEEVVELCKRKNKIITVDPKEEHIDYYEGVSALTPNLKEAQIAGGMTIKNKAELPLLGEVIVNKLKPQALLITLGEGGMMLFCGHKHYHIPTAAQEVFDVSGAGDTVIAVFTLALSCGATYLEAAHIANFAAGIVVGKLGTATTDAKELVARIKKSVL
jgi:D-beta-D-heptose 7-phosphate kinase/D-beta-D-heptose 1-phosphate adenosyltransferase